jgi:hypothetical protein
VTRFAITPLALVALAVAVPAWADHPGGLRQPGTGSPVLEALLWAGGAFVVGLAIVAAVSLLSRRGGDDDEAAR